MYRNERYFRIGMRTGTVSRPLKLSTVSTVTIDDNDNDLFARNTFRIKGYGKHDNQTT